MQNGDLRPFQRRFLTRALAPEIDTACLSTPRGNGKSWLAGYLAARVLTPGDALFVPGTESVLAGASIEQCRIVFRFARARLEGTGQYRFIDSATRCAILHKETNTRLRVVGSNGRTTFGLVNCPLVIADEPGSWETVGGQLMHDAIQTAQGKPNSPMKVIYIGTLAPSVSGWWHDLIERGTHGSTYVQALQGDRETWDQWSTIRKANPLTAISPMFRKKLLEERDAARRDSRLKARFLSYRLNLPTADEASMLLTVDDYKRMASRPEAMPLGRPLVGIDLGGGRAWSAAVAVWQSGRIEAMAVAPGRPSLEDQEKRDRVPAGTYRRLYEDGLLQVAEGLRVPTPSILWTSITERWGTPVKVVADRFRASELMDAVRGACPVEPRQQRWSEASFDIRGLRQGVQDGPLSVAPRDRNLIAASLSFAQVKNDDAGNVRLVKQSTNNSSRDDVAAALVLAAGAFQRAERHVPELTHVVI